MKNTCLGLLRVLAVTLSLLLIVGLTSMICFAADNEASNGIISVGVSIDEDILVRIRTTATDTDGSKVKVSFNGKETELTKNKSGVFSFAGVAPQYFGDTITATMYAKDGSQIGEPVSFTVKSYLEKLLTLSYEESGCATEIRYAAMRELAVNMLNYGAAAQIYMDYKADTLVNADLSDEHKALATSPITVSATDKSVIGSAWVGAGVRFDYRLGVYFVFTADSLDGLTATVNGQKVAPFVYDESKNQYVIRYSSFDATEMNSVITAKLSIGDTEQTYSYSVKSYVYAKGGETSSLAKLVNAAYTYGYAAVAYSGDLVSVDPTFETEGYASFDSKGYDFSESMFKSYTLPKLSLEDYDTKVTVSGFTPTPSVVTTFTIKNPEINYSTSITSGNFLSVDRGQGEIHVSEYNYSLLNTDIVTVTYDKENGYKYDIADGQTETGITSTGVRAAGAILTITGNLSINSPARWGHNNGLVVGTDEKPANITVKVTGTDADTYGLVIWDGAFLRVNKGSTLDVSNVNGDTIKGDKSAKFYIYGKVTSGGTINSNGTCIIYDSGDVYAAASYYKTAGSLSVYGKLNCNYVYVSGAPTASADYEYGFVPRFLVCGEVTLRGYGSSGYAVYCNAIQIGSEKYNLSGVLNINGANDNSVKVASGNDVRLALAKGTINLNTSATGKCAFDVRTTKTAYVTIKSGITINAKVNFGSIIGNWENGTYHNYVDLGFTYNGTVNNFFAMKNGTKSFYVSKSATVTIDGEERNVVLGTYASYGSSDTSNGYFTLSRLKGLNAVVEGADYTSTTETATYGNLGSFTKATYTDAAGTVHTIYYQLAN